MILGFLVDVLKQRVQQRTIVDHLGRSYEFIVLQLAMWWEISRGDIIIYIYPKSYSGSLYE